MGGGEERGWGIFCMLVLSSWLSLFVLLLGFFFNALLLASPKRRLLESCERDHLEQGRGSKGKTA